MTVPSDDWDIVLGKYLSAAAIFSVSLLFSQIANFMVLTSLAMGDIDVGLFVTTYVGYWAIGLAMISVGMVGSFLTKNQTIGFILGLVLNLPLVLTAYADAIIAGDIAQRLAKLSYSGQFFDFGRGVISSSSVVYFVLVACVALYTCMVLIGRRHWTDHLQHGLGQRQHDLRSQPCQQRCHRRHRRGGTNGRHQCHQDRQRSQRTGRWNVDLRDRDYQQWPTTGDKRDCHRYPAGGGDLHQLERGTNGWSYRLRHNRQRRY